MLNSRVRQAHRSAAIAVFLIGLLQTSVALAQGERVLPIKEYEDKLAGGFVGQMAGVVYGAPFEFKFEGQTVPEFLLPEWSPPMLAGALVQDDIYVEMTFLKTLEQYGPGVSQEQIGKDFAASKYPLWHANKFGRDNLRKGIMPPLSGHPRYNAHADDIDFQIEADVFGLITPGLPASSQDLTWKFGHVMNYGDGVYGGVFIAAMYSAAFFESDRVKVVESGLAAIPKESNYAKTIADVVAAYRANPKDWRRAWQVVEDKWAAKVHCPDRHSLYFWKHLGIGANVNGAYVVIGLLYGEGDPLRTVQIATMCGRDDDCNPSSAFGVLGTILGLKNIPAPYKAYLPQMKGRRFAYTNYDGETALAAMEGQARRQVMLAGGREEERTGEKLWIIPRQEAKALPLEQWAYGQPASAVPP